LKTSSILSKCYSGYVRPGKSVLLRLIHSSVSSNKNKTQNTIQSKYSSEIRSKNCRKRQNRYLYIKDRSLPWLGIFSSINSGGVKLILWDHSVKYHKTKTFFSGCCIEIVETKVNKWNCSDSGVFVMFLLEFKIVPTFYFRNASCAPSYTYYIFFY
jgi:hypothetical protein